MNDHSFATQELVLGFIVFAVLALIVALGAIRVIVRLERIFKYSIPTIDQPTDLHGIRFEIKQLPQAPAINSKNITLLGQSQPWQRCLAGIGKVYQSQGITDILVVHGTFTGDDPFGIIEGLKLAFPNIQAGFLRHIRRLTKASTNRLMRDTGNFTPGYLQLLEQGLAAPIRCHDFVWSSGNNHWARVEGAYLLLKTLAKRRSEVANGQRLKALLIGHSHAGQLFAILTVLLDPNHSLNRQLAALMVEFLVSEDELDELVALVSSQSLYFVTLGTPPRYPWSPKFLSQVVHLVNHREAAQASTRKRFISAHSGDMIQSFGVAGSDIPAATKEERLRNKKLDEWLGPGDNRLVWRDLVGQGHRPLNPGMTYLINFDDHNAKGWLSYALNIFGHGSYTQFRHLLSLQKFIAGHFFCEKNPR